MGRECGSRPIRPLRGVGQGRVGGGDSLRKRKLVTLVYLTLALRTILL